MHLSAHQLWYLWAHPSVGRRGIQSQTLHKIRNKEKIKYANNDAVRRPFSGDRIHEFLVLKLRENL